MSPCLQGIVCGILLVLPELKATLRDLQPRKGGRKPSQLTLGEDVADRSVFYLLEGRSLPVPILDLVAHSSV